MTEDRPTATDGSAVPLVRVRGVYATALTALLSGADGERTATVTRPSDPIRERFDARFASDPPDVWVTTDADRLGVAVTGESAAVSRVADRLAAVATDTLVVPDPAPRWTVVETYVERTVGGGAVVPLADGREGYLPFDRTDGYVETGDRLRVQVRDPVAPWRDRRHGVGTGVRVGGSLVALVRGADGVDAVVSGDRAAELVRTTDLLSATPPDGWGIEWQYPALDADVSAMDDALAAAAETAATMDDALGAADGGADDGDTPTVVAAPADCRWVWFGREARFELDDRRRTVTDTMAGHHRVKAGDDGASDAVDFLEAVCGSVGVRSERERADDEGTDPASATDVDFPFDAVTRQFGPLEGDSVRIAHGKPAGHVVDLGEATVTERDPDGQVVLRREMSSTGTYDALGTPRAPGDVATTRIREGRWWYPTAYRTADGEPRGTYVNVCTPVEVFPDAVRYVDLHVDVVRLPDGTVRRVDGDELAAAVEAGRLDETLAARARSVADRVERALS